MKKPIPFGKYFLLERMNVGGMAEVFRAKAYGVEGFERLLAVKRILPNIAEDQEFITMFIDEAKIAVQLNHANIAQIFDLGVVDGSYFIAMEHLFGRDLRLIFERCRAKGEPTPISQACFVVMKICEGLDYAHNKRDAQGREMNLVHRDVSPQNVLVSFEGEVKLIDFGIAKAAGKMGKTQAGILKGKFAYMSPEQVRGLPIDRRSDIFSTGIVLYELLTNERLFVGESDFSTLEKVRNVEILPPSTYNRKIPDELERIVMKALAKDVEDRYQNAIDLHDELQAFVYTAGEFYSRKDLASWMKKTFAKEIEEETAKLEQYRQISPPDIRPTSPIRSPSSPGQAERARRPTQTMPTMAPPPPPPQAIGQGEAPRHADVGSNGRPLSRAVTAPPVNAPTPGSGTAAPQKGDLSWDDEELETQIYDSPGQDQAEPSFQAAQGTSEAEPITGPAEMLEPEEAATPPALVGAQPAPSAKKTILGGHGLGGLGGLTAQPRDGVQAIPPLAMAGLAQAPMGTPSKLVALPGEAMLGDSRPGDGVSPGAAQGKAESASASKSPDPTANVVPANLADAGQSGRRGVGRWPLIAAAIVGISAVAVVAFVAGRKPSPSPQVNTPPRREETAIPPVVATKTGFDLKTDPSGLKVKLDGTWTELGGGKQALTPIGIQVAPGTHTIEVAPPPGFKSKVQEVVVEPGKYQELVLSLEPLDNLTLFTSEPPAAFVTLLINGVKQPLGTTPTSLKLDPRKRYEVLFEKEGYVPVTKPVEFGTEPNLTVAVVLERSKAPAARVAASGALPTTDAIPRRPVQPRPASPGTGEAQPREQAASGARNNTSVTTTPRPATESEGTQGKHMGFLAIGAKPPCRIFVDGRDTGLFTPQRGLEVPVGTRRVTLINNEHNIKEILTVEVKPGETVKLIKNFEDRIQKSN
ncbi:MAG: protein kinase [Deltaproteobacteria bacterium]|nr:protein kinase [Deltaproteobacteria bacterium]